MIQRTFRVGFGSAVIVLVSFGGAKVNAMPMAQDLSCRSASDLVRERGAVVLGTGPHLWQRFVVDQTHCALGEETRAEFAATKDSASCFIGYVCQTRTNR